VGGVLVVTAVLAIVLNHLSRGGYFAIITPADPVGAGPPSGTTIWTSLKFLAGEAFRPSWGNEVVAAGFAPYCTLATIAVLWIMTRWRRPDRAEAATRPLWQRVLAGGAIAGLLVMGYLPAFLPAIVKNQRTFFGEIFLALVVVDWIAQLVRQGRIAPRRLALVLAPALLLADAHYLAGILTVDHARVHTARFDLDLSDGKVRHDLVAAIDTMRAQMADGNAVLVVYYPRAFSENTTDPGLFFARFLRHFDRYRGRDDMIFPCAWCTVMYGCPFPEVVNENCPTCCYRNPAWAVVRRPQARLFVWWHDTMRDAKDMVVEAELQKLGADGQRVARKLDLPPTAIGWTAWELAPRR
jgi:hypothetical protein